MPRWIRFVAWDDDNIEHCARHGVSQEEADHVCFGESFAIRVRHDRYRLTGQTEAGRWISVIVSPLRPGEYYVITARDATWAERRQARRQ